jgi:very-short-patch-repair endonuclease
MKTDFYNRNMFYGADAITLRAAGILRKNMTLAELILWKKLKDKKIFKSKFRRQHPVDIFIVDFYCHEYKLAIEIDGEIHNNEETKEYDLGRTAELKNYGISVLRFTNDQVIYNLDYVVTRILEVLTKLTPL